MSTVGIRTLADLQRRCRMDEDSGCWLWPGHCNRDGSARVCYALEDGKRVDALGRRAALILGGTLPESGHYAFPTLDCEHANCVSPDHSRFGTRKDFGGFLRAKGSLRGLPKKVRACRENGRKVAKLTMEKAREIRALDMPDEVIAQRYGVSRSTVQAVRGGRLWREGAANSSVFNWRPAA